jgi:outer membrane biosynthesis protein TonB
LYNWKKQHAATAGAHVKAWGASALSIVAHSVLIGGAVWATEVAKDSYQEEAVQPFMMAFLNRAPKNAIAEQTIYADLSYRLEGVKESLNATTPRTIVREKPGDEGEDKANALLLKMDAIATDDSIFTSYEVDQIAEALFVGSGPIYPSELAKKRVEGLVIAQYVVDTTGWADTSSVNILQSSNPLFTNSVRAALGMMRFKPARIQKQAVRQMVQQSFIFRIPSDSTSE